MANKIARILADQAEQGDQSSIDALRTMAGLHVRSVQQSQQRVRSRVTHIQRDAAGRIVGSTERIEETEIVDSFGSWSQ